jgi:hypothetical protein
MSYKRAYIGKGKVNKAGIITLAICIDKIQEHTFEYEGKTYLKFDVAAMKSEDNFGKTHAAWISIKEEAPAVVNEPAPKKPRARKKA